MNFKKLVFLIALSASIVFLIFFLNNSGVFTFEDLGTMIGNGTALVNQRKPIDSKAPVLFQVTPVPSLTNDTTPNYTFSSTENGIIAYGGDCSSVTTVAQRASRIQISTP